MSKYSAKAFSHRDNLGRQSRAQDSWVNTLPSFMLPFGLSGRFSPPWMGKCQAQAEPAGCPFPQP